MAEKRILLYPYMTEKIVRLGDANVFAFIVLKKATRVQVKAAVEKLYGVTVKKVNIENAPRGKKKAYLTLEGEGAALDLAGKLGLM